LLKEKLRFPGIPGFFLSQNRQPAAKERNVQIKQLDPNATDLPLDRIIYIYRQAFGEAPWNEGYKCPKCESEFPLAETSKVCPRCVLTGESVYLVEYWPYDIVLADFEAQMKMPNAICLVAEIAGEVVGFAWGYDVLMSEELAEKIEAPRVARKLDGRFFCLDECAVEPCLQIKGIGKSIVRQIRSMERTQRFLVRTRSDCKMYPLLMHMGAEVVEKITRNRVIMVF
jgi:hypothetical protein